MPVLLRFLRSAAFLRSLSAQRSVYTAPAKEKIGTVETLIAMGAFSLIILGPSGWILAHLEDYKKKE